MTRYTESDQYATKYEFYSTDMRPVKGCSIVGDAIEEVWYGYEAFTWGFNWMWFFSADDRPFLSRGGSADTSDDMLDIFSSLAYSGAAYQLDGFRVCLPGL